jgi:PrgI family protein
MTAIRSGTRIPADVERPDRLLGGLTARQLAILTVTVLLAWAVGALASALVPLPVAAALAWPVLVVGLALALGRRDGLSLDRLVLAAWRQRRAPRRMVLAPDGVQPPPAWLPGATAPTGLPAPLVLPVRGLDGDGVLDLGPDGMAVICRASALTFGLRTEAEQAALVASFARFLHAIAPPTQVQILVRAAPVDLAGMTAAIEQAAGGLPHPALERAAREHARFLHTLAARRDVRSRELLVVFRQPTPAANLAGVAQVLGHAAEQAAALLAAAGITLRRLDTAQATAVLARAASPDRLFPPSTGRARGPGQEPALPGQIITGPAAPYPGAAP